MRSAQSCKKCTFSDNLGTITQEGNMGTIQMTPFFSSTFSDLTVCNIHFWIWKYSKFIFMWSPLWSILVFKIPQKLLIQTANHIFLESRHSGVTKNLYYVLSTRWNQIPIFLGSSSCTKKLVENSSNYVIFWMLIFSHTLFQAPDIFTFS